MSLRHNKTQKKPRSLSIAFNRKKRTLKKRRASAPAAVVAPLVVQKQTPIPSSFVESSSSLPCVDNSLCLSVGHNVKIIYEFFDKFSQKWLDKNFIYAVSNGNNGAVYKLSYTREPYTATAILKISQTETSDNLFYEACVGRYINKQQEYYPCFIKTYRFGKIDTLLHQQMLATEAKNILSTDINIDTLQPIDTLLPTPAEYKNQVNNSCINSLYNCVLTENLPDALSLDECEFFSDDKSLYFILFQVYSVLNQLKKEFTHYDLHTGNILLYNVVDRQDPRKKASIVMNYHISPNEILTFYTSTIAKIIDYGRCFFNESVDFNSIKIHQFLCYVPDCNVPTATTSLSVDKKYPTMTEENKMNMKKTMASCGEDKGYNWLTDNRNLGYVYSRINNITHDLLALRDLKLRFMNETNMPTNFFQRLYYNSKSKRVDNKTILYDGAPEDTTPYEPSSSIRNVYDAYMELYAICRNPVFLEHNAQMHASLPLIGTLDVYLYDKIPMRWQTAEGVSL